MRTRSLLVAAVLVALSVGAAACQQEAAKPAASSVPPPVSVERAALAPFSALPDAVPAAGGSPSADLVALGRMLYFEPRLSRSQLISCNTCHNLATYGVDNEPVSDGHKGQKGDRNSPTVFNAAAHFVQFWDGRAADVEAQAKGPVLNPVEMAMPSETRVVAVLTSMPEYVDAFKKAFPNDPKPVSYDNMAKAIGAFERGLMTPSRWDALLKGDDKALTDAEKIGFKTFTGAGCQACHAGALLGGTSFQRLGAAKAYPRADDPGRAKVTKNDADKGTFKVPSLRNVEKTGPYFHDGKTVSLDQAVREMGEYQLGRRLTPQEVAQIVDFLKVLTGKVDPEYTKPPGLPKSTVRTPKPDLT